ncbi:MAG: hypothetical protein NDI63_05910 [Pseudobdellovibrio sp.]|nr:hypothetical protein [Pseudobdellovibrio sp.]
MGKVNYHLIVFLALLMSMPVISAEQPAVHTKTIMVQFLQQLNAVKKYMASESRFNDPKNKIEIAESLKKFSEIAEATMHDPQLQLDNFKLSRDVLVKHIHETEKIYLEGNKNYARWMLNSTIYVCMSCHTQTPSSDKRFFLTKDSENYFSQFEQAEFLFASKNFGEASRIYDAIIRGMVKDENLEVKKSLQRQVAYYARIKRNPTEAIAVLKDYLKLKNLSAYIRRDLLSWINQFEKWQNDNTFKLETATDESIIQFAKAHLEGKTKNLVNYLRVSGLLYEFLQTHPNSKATPQILFWLAVCDRSIERNFFFSLADLYLRECITKYPADPIAKQCYSEYEKETIFSYSGSRGTDVPLSVRNDLNTLKALVESGGKVKLDIKK